MQAGKALDKVGKQLQEGEGKLEGWASSCRRGKASWRVGQAVAREVGKASWSSIWQGSQAADDNGTQPRELIDWLID